MPTIRLRGAFRGLREDVESSAIGPLEAEAALNVDVSKGTLRLRKGYTEEYSTAARCLGIAQFERTESDGSTISEWTFIRDGSTLTAFKTGGGSVADTNNYSTSRLTSFQAMNETMVVADGSQMRSFSGLNAWHDFQIARPDTSTWTAVTSTTGSPNPLAGDYTYYVTYYSSKTGEESASGDPVSITGLANNQPYHAVIGPPGGVPASADTRVDKLRIYRQKSTETVATFVSEFSAFGSNPTDRVADNDRDFTVVAPPRTEFNPKVKVLEYHDGVLFGTGEAVNKSRIYYTRPSRLSWGGFLESANDGEPFTALIALGGVVFAMKDRSIWVLSGNDPDSFSLEKVFDGIGCVSHWSIVQHRGRLYFAGEDSYYEFDGSNEPRDIGKPIQTTYQAREKSQDQRMVGGYFEESQCIFWAHKSVSIGDNVLAYFVDRSREERTPIWVPWELSGRLLSTANIRTASAPQTDFLAIGFGDDTTGVMRMGNADNDNGTGVDFLWRTGTLDGGVQERKKRWGLITVENVAQAAPGLNVNMNYRLDGATSSTLLAAHTQDDPIFRRRLARSSRDIQLEFEATAALKPVEIVAATIEANLSRHA